MFFSLITSIISAEKKYQHDLVFYTISPITSEKILPFNIKLPEKIGHEMNLIACPGEYEPGSFVVVANSDIIGLHFTASDLVGKSGVIPANNVDIKLVKCWYQAGSAWIGIGQDKRDKVLVPELLVNDDTLVKVDYEKKENYLKLSFPDGERYVWISDTTELRPYYVPTPEEYPVKDSPTLLPVNIPANSQKQVWVTVQIPEDALSGIYKGKINLMIGKKNVGTITLNVKVLPFKLAEPYYTSSIYYRGRLDATGKGSVSSELKSRTQLIAEYKNMLAHGVTNPIVYQPITDTTLLGEVLSIREQVGIKNQPLYYLGLIIEKKDQLDTIKSALAFFKQYGISEVYFYGRDEARGTRLTEQREAWDETRKVGGKIFVAGYRDSNFEKMGDIQDLLVCAFKPSKEEADKWHSLGHKIWSYSYPQIGVENPEVYRRNYGLLLWQNNYDGAADYAYQHSFGNIWNDFDHPQYRDHVFAYPTVDGVIDTIAWEGYREGVDDVRYLTTLLQAIETAKKSNSSSLRDIAAKAEQYLANLNLNRNLDIVRLEMIYYILLLHQNQPKTEVVFDSVLSSTIQEIQKSYPIYQLEQEPQLDGNVEDDIAWQNIPAASDFLLLKNQIEFAPKQTYFKIGYTSTALYVGIECLEPEMDKVKGEYKDNQSVWLDDSNEIFIKPYGSRAYYQFAINIASARWSGISFGEGSIPLDQWQGKAYRGEQKWSVELKIPFSILKRIPEHNEQWQGNICRNVYTAEERSTSWAHLETGYHIPEKFGTYIFYQKTLSPEEAQRITQQLTTTFYKNQITENLRFFSINYEPVLSKLYRMAKHKKDIQTLKNDFTTLKNQLKIYDSLSLPNQKSLFAQSVRLNNTAIDLVREVIIQNLFTTD
ncbi:MAG: hypothetical protein N3A72_01065 [bacterium]|nr:hypothetical protein [bacterium]